LLDGGAVVASDVLASDEVASSESPQPARSVSATAEHTAKVVVAQRRVGRVMAVVVGIHFGFMGTSMGIRTGTVPVVGRSCTGVVSIRRRFGINRVNTLLTGFRAGFTIAAWRSMSSGR
jgi:hypothetical protein